MKQKQICLYKTNSLKSQQMLDGHIVTSRSSALRGTLDKLTIPDLRISSSFLIPLLSGIYVPGPDAAAAFL